MVSDSAFSAFTDCKVQSLMLSCVTSTPGLCLSMTMSCVYQRCVLT
jgi:hypothetical protein